MLGSCAIGSNCGSPSMVVRCDPTPYCLVFHAYEVGPSPAPALSEREIFSRYGLERIQRKSWQWITTDVILSPGTEVGRGTVEHHNEANLTEPSVSEGKKKLHEEVEHLRLEVEHLLDEQKALQRIPQSKEVPVAEKVDKHDGDDWKCSTPVSPTWRCLTWREDWPPALTMRAGCSLLILSPTRVVLPISGWLSFRFWTQALLYGLRGDLHG